MLLENNRPIPCYGRNLEFGNGKCFRRVTEEGYIANLNIEYSYSQKMGKYEEFKNICLVDTLDHTSFEGKQFDIFAMSVENIARIKRQNDYDISVIIGNPPYNANQQNENDNNKNRSYQAEESPAPFLPRQSTHLAKTWPY